MLLYGEQTIPANGNDSMDLISVAGFIVHDLSIDDLTFQNPYYQFIFDDFQKEMEKGRIPSEKDYVNHADPSVAQLAIDLVSTPYELSDGWSKNLILVKVETEILKKRPFLRFWHSRQKGRPDDHPQPAGSEGCGRRRGDHGTFNGTDEA